MLSRRASVRRPVNPLEAHENLHFDAFLSLLFGSRSPGRANGEIRSCALPDCKGGVKSLATGLAGPNSLALSNNVLFWSNGGTTGAQAVKGSIQKLPL